MEGLRLTSFDHDHAVRNAALELVMAGYQVWARLDGWFDNPDVINGYRPDILAYKEGRYIIVEVKKGEVDWPKIMALQVFSEHHREYEVRVITP